MAYTPSTAPYIIKTEGKKLQTGEILNYLLTNRVHSLQNLQRD